MRRNHTWGPAARRRDPSLYRGGYYTILHRATDLSTGERILVVAMYGGRVFLMREEAHAKAARRSAKAVKAKG
ncbi:MAG: hypothetical protein ACLPGW_19640 [Roseiarcus sp.]